MKKYSFVVIVALVVLCAENLSVAMDSPYDVWQIEYRPVNFAVPVRDTRVDEIYPINDPMPSKVGFYKGSMESYKEDLLTQYPDGSCMESASTGGFNEPKILEFRDNSASQRIEHVLQDGVMQGELSQRLGSIDTVTGARDAAKKSRDLYAYVFSLGRSKPTLPNLSEELVQRQLEKTLTQEYLCLKYDCFLGTTVFDFQNSRNAFVEKMNKDKNNNFTTIEAMLVGNHNSLRDKVIAQEQTKELNRQVRNYRLGSAALLTTLAATGTGLYFYTKSNK